MDKIIKIRKLITESLNFENSEDIKPYLRNKFYAAEIFPVDLDVQEYYELPIKLLTRISSYKQYNEDVIFNILMVLHEFGAQLNSTEKDPKIFKVTTPLMEAIQILNYPVVSALLELGVDPDSSVGSLSSDINDYNPLTYASIILKRNLESSNILKNPIKIVEILIENRLF